MIQILFLHTTVQGYVPNGNIAMLCATSNSLESMKLHSKVIIPLYLHQQLCQTYIFANLKCIKLTHFNLHFIHQQSVRASFPNTIDQSRFFFYEVRLHSLCSFCLVFSFLYIGYFLCAGYYTLRKLSFSKVIKIATYIFF